MRQYLAAGICVLLPAIASAQPAAGRAFSANDFIVDDGVRERVVSDVVHQLEQKSVFPERVEQELPSLIGRWSSPPFLDLTSESEVVSAINADLTDAFHDSHVLLVPVRGEDVPGAMFAATFVSADVNSAVDERAREASCYDVDFGECAPEQTHDVKPPPAAILDCESPFIAEMIGSCDLPKPTIPSLHLPTLRTGGNGFVVAARNGSTERLTIVSAPTSVDAALPLHPCALAPSLHATPLFALVPASVPQAPRNRLDRPPRV
jgi:hypothetical protein